MDKKTKSPVTPAKGKPHKAGRAGLRRRTRMIALEPRMLFDGALGIDLGSKATAALMGDQSVATDATPTPAAPEPQKDTSAQSTASTATAPATATPAEKDALQKPGAEALDAS